MIIIFNISQATYARVKEFFDCEYRGMVEAKGKGEVEMYFLLRIKPEFSADAEGRIPNAKFEMQRVAAGVWREIVGFAHISSPNLG